MWDKILNSLINFGKTYGIKIAEAVVILIFGVLIIKLFMRILKKICDKSKVEKTVLSLMISVIRFVLYIILILIIVSLLGINITGLVAILTTASLAIGLALQNNLSNMIDGIVIIMTKPFRQGDYVQIAGVEGSVKNIRMLTTAIVATDNKLIVIPNSKIINSEIVNYSILGRRRINFTFKVAYESDVKKVRDIITKVLNSDDRIEREPEPFVALKTLGDNSLEFFANCWCKSSDYWGTYYYVVQNVFNEFKKEKIKIPLNQMEVRLRDDKVPCYIEENILHTRSEKPVQKSKVNRTFLTDYRSMMRKTQKTKEEMKQEKKENEAIKKQLEKEKKEQRRQEKKNKNKKNNEIEEIDILELYAKDNGNVDNKANASIDNKNNVKLKDNNSSGKVIEEKKTSKRTKPKE